MLRILKETDQYIAVYKPAGMAVQSADVRRMDLTNQLMNELVLRQRRLQRSGRTDVSCTHPYLAMIHRLDQPVEGIVLYAKSKGAAARLSDMLQKHQFTKKYLAVTDLPEGADQREGQWYHLTDYLVRDGRTNTSRIASPGEAGARRAELQYRIIGKSIPEKSIPDQKSLQESVNYGRTELCRALLEIDLYTGRHHQIRVQLAHAGMPIAGDRKYGINNVCAGENSAGVFPALCAAELAFADPWSGEDVDIRICPEGKCFSEKGWLQEWQRLKRRE